MLTQGQSQNVSATSGRDRKTPKMALYFTIAGSCLSLATGFQPSLAQVLAFTSVWNTSVVLDCWGKLRYSEEYFLFSSIISSIFSRRDSVFYDEEKTHSRAKCRRTDEGSTTQKPNGKWIRQRRKWISVLLIKRVYSYQPQVRCSISCFFAIFFGERN